MLPPMFLRVRVQGDKRRIRLWIPVIVLWPVIAVVVLLGTPVAVLVAARSGSFRPAGRPFTSIRACLAARPTLRRSLWRGPRVHFNRLGGCDD